MMADFYSEEIEVQFDREPLIEKKPGLPSAFIWRGQEHIIVELLKECVAVGRTMVQKQKQHRLQHPNRPASTSFPAPWSASSSHVSSSLVASWR